MRKYYVSGQMDLSDRIAIETGICSKESFKKIAKRTGRHPSTIAHEVKENRTFISCFVPEDYENWRKMRLYCTRWCTFRIITST